MRENGSLPQIKRKAWRLPTKSIAMIASFPSNVTLHHLVEVLLDIDKQLANKVKAASCPYCGGNLNNAFYSRKPRGTVLEDMGYITRFSLCCRREGCRKRVLPPSTLFLGRTVYWSCIILVSVALQQLNVKTAEQIEKRFGVPLRTIRRWIAYYREQYLQSRSWFLRQGFIPLENVNSGAIGRLYHSFMKHHEPLSGLTSFVRFMGVDP